MPMPIKAQMVVVRLSISGVSCGGGGGQPRFSLSYWRSSLLALVSVSLGTSSCQPKPRRSARHGMWRDSRTRDQLRIWRRDRVMADESSSRDGRGCHSSGFCCGGIMSIVRSDMIRLSSQIVGSTSSPIAIIAEHLTPDNRCDSYFIVTLS
jgi:hypothetical protein